ncbi:flagellar hook-associated protein FlgL [Virgibacillus profundi]|uniref:Flagellar hook-associated protein FlgL n=1 Tax=Virgibacillus profundi TaxID=2024555 RepID=A0A2A2II88_9BACI|nr:flagellar hook-associated protein FlgL [Virgibacillus profundi]PAV31016.1 flagellar hook-associated protein FlgL [Virgibacillus profundi]PXY55201.1 flagellar hook-associated protein FlgL [Virgibacillus profundi]
MRVTQGMLSNNMLHNLSNSYSKMGTIMDQLNTGKKINRPSDDPVIAMKGMNYRSQVTEIEQFKRNTNEVHNWMDNSDAALDKATQAMQRLRELAVKASNGTNDTEELASIKEEVTQLKEHLKDIAGTEVNGKYIFNGTNTDVPPEVDLIEGTFEGESPDVKIEVSDGTKLTANVSGEEVFGDLFGTINDLESALEGDGDIAANIKSIDDDINGIINARADLGARMNRLELIENRLDEQEVIATSMMSKNEDVDYSKAITELITQESLHRAALSAGSRIIQPSLMDFLR